MPSRGSVPAPLIETWLCSARDTASVDDPAIRLEVDGDDLAAAGVGDVGQQLSKPADGRVAGLDPARG